MESSHNTACVLDIIEICGVGMCGRTCNVLARTLQSELVRFVFEDVVECRSAGENTLAERASNMEHLEEKTSCFLEIRNSEYIQYVNRQASFSLPAEDLKDYIVFDWLGRVVEVVTSQSPRVIYSKADL